MPGKSFDPTFKALVELSPEDWTDLISKRRAPTTIIDADIATVSGAADKVLHVADAPPYLLHLDFQAGHDSAGLPPLLLQRNVLLYARHGLPVRTVAVALRPEADSPTLTGRLEVKLADDSPSLVFHYDVMRVWRIRPEVFLEGGIALLPLATISDVTYKRLSTIIQEIQRRLSEPRAQRFSNLIWSATGLLMGLRYTEQFIDQLLGATMGIEESVIYQRILRTGEARGESKGALTEARKMVLKLGRKRFGAPPTPAKVALAGIADIAELERLFDKLLDVNSWEELLDLPRGRRRRNGRQA